MSPENNEKYVLISVCLQAAFGNDKATDTIPYPRQTDALAQVPQHSNALHWLLNLSTKHHTLLKHIQRDIFCPYSSHWFGKIKRDSKRQKQMAQAGGGKD